MLTKPLVQTQFPPSLLSSSSACLFPRTVGSCTALPIFPARKGSEKRRIRCSSDVEAAQQAVQQSIANQAKTPKAVKAVLTVKVTVGGMFAHVGITRGLDDIADLLGKTLLLELVSNELDPSKGCDPLSNN